MKKLLLIYTLFALILAGNHSFAQTAGDKKSSKPVDKTTTTTTVKKGWASEDRHTFITDCIGTAVQSMSRDSARFYCYCMQEKLEKKFPDFEEANKLSADDLETPEWQKTAQDCIGGIGSWSATERSEFISECINSAKASVGEAKAKNYCECMLFKIQQRYPDPEDAAGLDEETLASPEWKKIIQSCLDF